MSKRYQHILTLAELRRNIREFPTLADQHIYNTILESLPPTHRKLYRWIRSHGGEGITTSFVMTGWRYTETYASSLLNELWQFGLLERAPQNDNPRVFEYRVANVDWDAIHAAAKRWEDIRDAT